MIQPSSEELKNLVTQKVSFLKDKWGSSVLSVDVDRAGTPVVWLDRSKVIDVLKYLQSDQSQRFDFLADLTCYDDLGTPEQSQGRFVVVYNLLSLQDKTRLRIKVRVAEGQSVSTAISLWKAANWAEREVWDVYGVVFDGHPDLRRILLDQRFEGHPQRKDYPWRKYQLFLEPEHIPEHLLKK